MKYILSLFLLVFSHSLIFAQAPNNLEVDTTTLSPEINTQVIPDSIRSQSQSQASKAVKSDTQDDHRLYPFSVFFKTQIKFIDFEQRERFQKELDHAETTLKSQQVDSELAARIRAQDFQKVNLSFPLFVGWQYRITQDLSLSGALGYLYHQQETLLQIGDNSQVWAYILESFPLYIELSHLIPDNILSINEVNHLTIGGRIYGHYGDNRIRFGDKLIASQQESGYLGWAAFLGYEYLNWNRLTLNTEIEYSSLSAQSDSYWYELLPNTSSEKPQSIAWDLGGIALSFNLAWNFGPAL